MTLSEARLQQVNDLSNRVARAMKDLEWAYRGLYYGNAEAPAFEPSLQRATRAAQAILDLAPTLASEVEQE